jgi:hypothetical protein
MLSKCIYNITIITVIVRNLSNSCQFLLIPVNVNSCQFLVNSCQFLSIPVNSCQFLWIPVEIPVDSCGIHRNPVQIPVDSCGIRQNPVHSGGFRQNRWRNKKYCARPTKIVVDIDGCRSDGDGRSAGHDMEDGGKERLIVWLTIGLYSI